MNADETKLVEARVAELLASGEDMAQHIGSTKAQIAAGWQKSLDYLVMKINGMRPSDTGGEKGERQAIEIMALRRVIQLYTTPPIPIASCEVEWTGWDWQDEITVKSPSGTKITVEIHRAVGGWSAFSDEQKALFQKLMQGKWNTKRMVDLTYPEMRLFQNAQQQIERQRAEHARAYANRTRPAWAWNH